MKGLVIGQKEVSKRITRLTEVVNMNYKLLDLIWGYALLSKYMYVQVSQSCPSSRTRFKHDVHQKSRQNKHVSYKILTNRAISSLGALSDLDPLWLCLLCLPKLRHLHGCIEKEQLFQPLASLSCQITVIGWSAICFTHTHTH